MRKMSAAGKKFLEGWEGCVLAPYDDAGGNATIGIGHLIHYGPVTTADRIRYNAYHGPHGHRPAHSFDLKDAYVLLGDDLLRFEQDLADYIHVDLTQNQVDATIDFIYNCGPAPLAGTFGQLLNARNYTAAADNMLGWDHAGGTVLEGLARRRAADRALFLSAASFKFETAGPTGAHWVRGT